MGALTSVVARVVTTAVLYLGILFSLNLWLTGHNVPGGGFVAGAMTGSVFALLYLVFGKAYVETHFQTDYRTIASAGILLVVLFALLPLAFDLPLLTNLILHLDLPLVGPVEVTSATGFDFGIYLAVVGAILTILRRGAGGVPSG